LELSEDSDKALAAIALKAFQRWVDVIGVFGVVSTGREEDSRQRFAKTFRQLDPASRA
jgi:hypothetical protein